MIPEPPAGQGPIDPRGAFSPPPPPKGSPGPFPPMMPMPPMMPHFGPPPRGGFLKGVATVLIILFVLGAGFFGLLVWAAQSLSNLGSSKNVSQTVLMAGDPKEQIGVIDIDGMIVNSTAQRFARLIHAAAHDSTIKALVIRVETPGGMVTSSDQIYHDIMKFRHDNPNVHVVISMGGLATSGGYYISCAGERIFAEETTLTADIGVIMEGINVSQLANRWGIADTTLSAPRGGYKAAGWPLAPVNQRDTDYMQSLVDEMFKQFKSIVTASRKLTRPIDEIANGQAIFAADALKMGLVDDIGYFDDACSCAANLSKLGSNPQIVQLRDTSSGLLERLAGADGQFTSGHPQATTTVNGVNINLDTASLQEFSGPRLLYLYRGN